MDISKEKLARMYTKRVIAKKGKPQESNWISSNSKAVSTNMLKRKSIIYNKIAIVGYTQRERERERERERDETINHMINDRCKLAKNK